MRNIDARISAYRALPGGVSLRIPGLLSES
jgi:hypothetical protein